MSRYALRRILINVPVLLGVTILVFTFIQLAPGDPLAFYLSPDTGVSEADLAALRQKLGLDQPPPIRYLVWLGQVATGNLGYRTKNFDPVGPAILDRLPATLLLMGSALLLGVVVGIPLGLLSAIRQYSALDFALTALAFLGISMPGFFLGLAALFLFALKIPVFPVGGMLTTAVEFDLLDLLRHLVLPAMILGLTYVASLLRYTRSSMLEVIRLEFVTTARSKGLAEQVVILRHALRNALLPVITVIGFSLPSLFGGAVIIEAVFAWPGLGSLYIDGVSSRDYPLVMGMTLVSATLILSSNLLTDLAYALVDPRIRSQ